MITLLITYAVLSGHQPSDKRQIRIFLVKMNSKRLPMENIVVPRPGFQDLPTEIIENILVFMQVDALLSFALTSQRNKNITLSWLACYQTGSPLIKHITVVSSPSILRYVDYTAIVNMLRTIDKGWTLRPTLFVFYGPPATGKSSVIRGIGLTYNIEWTSYDRLINRRKLYSYDLDLRPDVDIFRLVDDQTTKPIYTNISRYLHRYFNFHYRDDRDVPRPNIIVETNFDPDLWLPTDPKQNQRSVVIRFQGVPR